MHAYPVSRYVNSPEHDERNLKGTDPQIVGAERTHRLAVTGRSQPDDPSEDPGQENHRNREPGDHVQAAPD